MTSHRAAEPRRSESRRTRSRFATARPDPPEPGESPGAGFGAPPGVSVPGETEDGIDVNPPPAAGIRTGDLPKPGGGGRRPSGFSIPGDPTPDDPLPLP